MSTEKIHLRGRAALIAAVCHSFGFLPSDSLVVVSLCGAGNTMGPTMRVDLPTAGGPMVVPAAICRVLGQYADAVVVIVFCHNSLRSRGQATTAAEMLEALIEVRDVLYVTGARVGSYRDGTDEPWSMQDAPDHLLITGGRTVLASRQALCDLLDPAAVGQSVGAGQLDDAATEMQRLDPAALASVADRLYRQAVTRAGRGQALPDDLGADLLAALSAPPIRDGMLPCLVLTPILLTDLAVDRDAGGVIGSPPGPARRPRRAGPQQPGPLEHRPRSRHPRARRR